MSAARFPSINNRMKRSLPKFGVRCTISRPTFPLGAVGCAGFGFPKSLGKAFVSVGETKIAHTTATPSKRLVRKFTPQFIRRGVPRQALRLSQFSPLPTFGLALLPVV